MIPSTSSHVNIDGDVIVYAVGFASEQKRHRTSDGKLFEEQADADRYVDRYDLEPWEIVKVPDDLGKTLHSVRVMVDTIVEAAKATTYTVYLTGPTNFRDDVARFQPYKGHRADSAKPTHYEAIRAYLMEECNGSETIGQEADDALSILACEKGHTIATIDKDLDNTAGWHYNWKRDDLYYVNEREADLNFHLQLLTGDATDNIPGLFKATGKKAMAKTKNRVIARPTPREMYEEVIAIYEEACEEKEVDLNVKAFIKEIGQLLWMRREAGQMYGEHIYAEDTTAG